ncbi:MAG: helix-turn-helix domain-containing protein [Rubrobacteraceae bacterium]
MSGDRENFHAQDGSIQIGPTLEKARQDFGLSHEDVEEATKIRVRYLEAMERDDFEALPGAVYAQGFLRTYANYLNLDGEELSRQLGTSRPGQTGGPAKNVVREDDSTGLTEPPRLLRRHRRTRRRGFSGLGILASVLGALLLVGVVAGLYIVGLQAIRSSEEPQEGPARVEEQPAPEEPPPNDEPRDPAATSPEKEAKDEDPPENAGSGEAGRQNVDTGSEEPPAPPPQNLKLTVRVENTGSWLNIETDGNVVFEQLAQPGFSQTFEAEERVSVWCGDAGSVFIEVNGQDYGRLGEPGETKVQGFTLKTAES